VLSVLQICKVKTQHISKVVSLIASNDVKFVVSTHRGVSPSFLRLDLLHLLQASSLLSLEVLVGEFLDVLPVHYILFRN
jgi:hypothetical protein